MGSISIGNSTIIPSLVQQVLINGSLRSEFYCLEISKSHSGQGTTATLSVPSWCWDADKAWLRGAKIIIKAGYAGNALDTLFCGYITKATGEVSDRSVRVEAKSLIALADTVYIGQNHISEHSLKVDYPEYYFDNGVKKKSRWTIKSVLRDWFSHTEGKTIQGGGGTLPSEWRSELKLGSLSVLDRTWNKVRLGDISFEQATLRTGLDTLLQAVGYVRFYEEFRSNGDTYLQFYEIASYKNDRKSMKIAGVGECIRGSNIKEATYSENLEEVKNRIIAFGQPKKYMITLTVANGGLIKGWNTNLEAAVKADPETTYRGSIEQGETTLARQRVFKEYYINEDFRDIVVDGDNFLEFEDGKKLPIQVLKWGYSAISYDSNDGTWIGTISLNPTEVIEGVQLDMENLRFSLSDPALILESSVILGGEVYDTWTEAKIGLTITVSADTLTVDTESIRNGYKEHGIIKEGLTEVVGPANFQFEQFTNDGFPIGGTTYNDVWYWTEADGMTNVPTKVIDRDDTIYLDKYANAMALEKSGVKTTYNIGIPFFSTGYEIGDLIRVVGQRDFKDHPHIVENISWNLTNNHSTTISTDSAEPAAVSQIITTFE